MGDFTNCLSAFVLYGALGLGTIDESPAADLGMPRCRGFRSLWEAKQADREQVSRVTCSSGSTLAAAAILATAFS